MPWVGVRQRAAAVVCLVTVVLMGTALAPADAQLVVLDPTTTTSPPAPTTTQAEPTTTSPSSPTTGVPPTTPTTSGSGRTATTGGSGSSRPSTTTTRRPATTTTEAVDTTTPTPSRPTTTGAGGFPGDTTTPTTGDLTMTQASSNSGLSAGRIVALIIAGLLAVALGLSALTVRYVRSTQPPDRFVA